MKRRALAASASCLACCSPQSADVALAQEKRATLTIRAGEPGPQISRHLYGHFAEHLGRCIYGGFWVGQDSPIPNTRGIRNDVVAGAPQDQDPEPALAGRLLRRRVPLAGRHRPAAKRPRRVNIHWGGVVEDNSFGTHEFLDLCEQLGADPYVAANVGSGIAAGDGGLGRVHDLRRRQRPGQAARRPTAASSRGRCRSSASATRTGAAAAA